MFQPIWFASFPQLLLLYSIELVTLFYLVIKYKSLFCILIILLFYSAIFVFIGKNIQNSYRVVIVILTLWISYRNKIFAFDKKGDRLITIFFVLFSLFFVFSAFSNNDSWTIIFSQYSRYLIAYFLWFKVRKEINSNPIKASRLRQFIFDIILMQIIISIGKLFIFRGRQIESIVGSISHIGGAAGTILPILGFIGLWFYKRGKFKLKDWLFVAGLMLIGFLAGKRAVWFIMPFVVFGFMIYVPKVKLNKILLVVLLIVPLVFYFGVRLTPTLNPEHKLWGSFDTKYSLNYANEYQFGKSNSNNNKLIEGRGGATLWLFDKWNSNKFFTKRDWFGIGLANMYGTDYKEFGKLNTGLSWKGSASGIFQTYITTGYLGIFATISFFFTMLWQVKIKRIRWVLLGIVAWEYFMYTGLIFRTEAFMFLIIYFVHYSNFLARKRSIIQQVNQSHSNKISSNSMFLS